MIQSAHSPASQRIYQYFPARRLPLPFLRGIVRCCHNAGVYSHRFVRLSRPDRMRFLTPALGVCQFTQSEGEWAEADMQSTPTSEENRDSRREIEELTGVRQNRIRVI